jgi:hypothetical protein
MNIDGLTRQSGPARMIMQDDLDRLKAEAADLQNNARIADLHSGRLKRRRAQRKDQRNIPIGWLLA